MASEDQCGRHLLNETWRGEEYGGQFHVETVPASNKRCPAAMFHTHKVTLV